MEVNWKGRMGKTDGTRGDMNGSEGRNGGLEKIKSLREERKEGRCWGGGGRREGRRR